MDFKEYNRKMDKTLEVLASDFGAVRAGRANSQVLDRISVPYYGVDTPIGQVASISSPDPRTLVIQPWDTKILKDIAKAIQMSDLGINPQNDGRVIRLTFPQLTEDRRKELVKQVKKYAEVLFNMLSRLVIGFLPRSKCLLMSWLQSPSAVILEPRKIKLATVSTVSPSICHEVIGSDAMILVF